MKMEVKDILPIVFERANAASTLWNIEIVTILGLIAFFAGAGKQVNHTFVKLAIVIGFVIMASFNLAALIEVTEQRHALVTLLLTKDSTIFSSESVWVNPLLIPPVCLVAVLHIVVDILVIIFVLVYPKYAPR
jgi:hypothetical protein